MAKEKKDKVKKNNRSFIKDFKAELKKVTWPTSKQMVSDVTAVIVIVLVTVAIVFCLDFAFGAANKYGIEKIKNQVQSSNQQQTIVEDTTTEGNTVSEENTEDVVEQDSTNENSENTESVSND